MVSARSQQKQRKRVNKRGLNNEGPARNSGDEGNNLKTTTKGFKPGQSGNPSGRPKKTPEEIDLVKACRSKGHDALMVLEKIMLHGSETNRLKAAMAILERGYGRPEQPVASASAGIVVMISEQDALI